MRVALDSPLPPQPSGIADYAAELLPWLARHVDVELVVERGFRPAAELAAWPRRRAPDLAAAVARGDVDLPLYQLGDNSRFHAGIWRRALALPGVVVLHELALHHLVRDSTLHRGNAAAYVAEVAYAGGAAGEKAASQAVASGVPLDPYRWPLFERLVDRSLGVIVHSDFARAELLRRRPGARVATVHLHLSLPSGLPDRGEARRRLALAPDVPLVAAFGVISTAKRPFALLRAFRQWRQRRPEARLIFVGEPSGELAGAEWPPAALAEGVEVTGRLDFERFLLFMQACDVAVNLRHPSGGETSATLVRLLGLGKPVVVTDGGPFAEIPDACCVKVAADSFEEPMLTASLEALLGDEALRRAIGENARTWCATEHSIERSAAGYAEMLALARG